MSPTRDDDLFFHPSTERELIELVNLARRADRRIRVHGSGHSVAHARFADPVSNVPNRVDRDRQPASHENIDILLDRYAGYSFDDHRDQLVVEAGMHIGQAPGHPGGDRPGLLQVLRERGWTLPATGGITHQTVSGFIATASAGGSRQHTFDEAICGVRVIHANGEPRDYRPGDPDFPAMVGSLGLLGIVSTVTFKRVDAFNIAGTEATVPATGNHIVDLFGNDSGGPPSLSEFLTRQEYARIEWWPQGNVPRIVAWTSRRLDPEDGFTRNPYVQFKDGELEQAAVSVIFTLLGKLDLHGLLPAHVTAELEPLLAQLGPQRRRAAADLVRAFPDVGSYLAQVLEDGSGDARARAATEGVVDVLKATLPNWFPALLDTFVPLDASKPPQSFQDHSWDGLPTDLAAKDKWLPVEFTEIWVPLDRAEEVMRRVHDYFQQPGEEQADYKRTGTFAFELYAQRRSDFWMHPAYSDGADDWKAGAFRFNAYWFRRNTVDPLVQFFPSFWDLLRDADIPYRLHWGKFLPRRGDDPNWQHVKAQSPQWERFLELRERLDPQGMFLNRYWADHLGIDVSSTVRRMIADLHSHYPLHLLADAKPNTEHRKLCGLPMTWLDRRRAFVMGLLAVMTDFEGWSKGWRVSLDGLVEGKVGLLLSALYDPASEWLVVPRRFRPRTSSFSTLTCILDCVEADLRRRDPSHTRHVLVKSTSDLDSALATGRMAFVHCIEGGFHLGPDAATIDEHVAYLARRGIAYVTLAHLFYRGVAAAANGLPFLSDRWYNRLHVNGGKQDLSILGHALVRALYKHRILIDIAHMRADALTRTFALLDRLDEEHGRDPSDYPVIASHAGYRFGTQTYMLHEQTIRQIARRDGVIGLILARHQLQDGLADANNWAHSLQILASHIDRIRSIAGSHLHTCIGSDLDGFIKPTMSGIESAADLWNLDGWLRGAYPSSDADAILSDNAVRVVRRAFATRAPALA